MKLIDTLRDRYQVDADPLRTERRVELVLVVLVALLLLQLAWSGARASMSGLPDAKAPSRESLAVRESLEREALPPGSSEAIVARPLFWQGRRPLEAEAPGKSDEEKAAAKKSKIKDVKLLGVFGAGEGAGIIALVKEKQRRFLVGESVNGWELVAVSSNAAELRSGAITETLALEIRGASAVALAAAEAQPKAAPKRTTSGTEKKKKQQGKKSNKKQAASVKLVPGQLPPRPLLPSEPSQ